MMDLSDYFAYAKGHGVLATSDEQGRVNMAIFSRPHVFEDQTIAFIMPHHLTHSNLQSKPHAAYLFMEDGPGYQGKRLYLTKIREEQDTELLRSLRRRVYPPGQEKPGPRFLVFFQVDKILPLIGAGEVSAPSWCFRELIPQVYKEELMAEAIRITPEETYQKLRAGKALLVCAYDNEERFRNLQLEGAISFSELRAKLPVLSKDQEIILYCAWSSEHSSARVAAELNQQGYVNAKALLGGVAAWQHAGFPVVPANA